MSTIQRTTIVRHSLKTIEGTIVQFLQNRYLFFVMASLQLAWLVSIVWTGTSTNWSKLWPLTIYSILAGITVVILPDTFIVKLRDFNRWLLQKERRWIFCLCVIALIAGASYAFNQNAWGDEGRSFRVAQTLAAEGLEASYLDSGWLRNRHPPLMPLVYGLTVNLVGANLFSMRLVSVVFMAATLVVTYLIGRKLYDRDTGFLAPLFLLSFPLVIRLGASAMMDMQVAFFFSLALLLVLYLPKKPSFWLSALIGLVIGLGLLTKYMMFLIFVVLLTYVIFNAHYRKLKRYFAFATLISISLFVVWIFYAYQIGILSGQIQKITNESGIYHIFRTIGVNIQILPVDLSPIDSQTDDAEISDNRANLMRNGIFRLGLESFFTRIPSSLGVHHFPLILIGGLYLLRKRSPADMFVLLWIGVVFFILFLTLPDHRYFLPAFPAIAIMVARMFHRFPEHQERALLLALLLWAGNLYLFVDWVREAHLFLLR
jgi:4-amino-4-deoxy-L-arabinose transferase-like glycosyltransferase